MVSKEPTNPRPSSWDITAKGKGRHGDRKKRIFHRAALAHGHGNSPPLATAILDPNGRCLLVNAAWNALWAPVKRAPRLEPLREQAAPCHGDHHLPRRVPATRRGDHAALFTRQRPRRGCVGWGVYLSRPRRVRNPAGDGTRARGLHRAKGARGTSSSIKPFTTRPDRRNRRLSFWTV